MAAARASVFFPCPAEQVFSAVTDLSQTGWRSDLAGVEVLDEARFVERTKSGYATHFVITACAPPRLWALRMENGNLFGSWCGRFAPERGGTRLDCVERTQAKRWWMRPFVLWYLRRQQRRYLEDLRERLSEMQPKSR